MISVLCPTRQRPDNVWRLVKSIMDTRREEVEVVFYTDDDAPDSVPGDVRSVRGITVIEGPRIILSDTWNKCWEKAQGDIFMLCGDDIVFRTPGWDEMVREAFDRIPDKIAYVYGNDAYQGESLGTHGFVHRAWTDAIGRFTPPYFSSDYPDTWLNDVAIGVGRRVYLPDLITEHMHPVAHKAGWDHVYEEKAQRHQRDNPAAIYHVKHEERVREVILLKRAMGVL